MDETASFGYWLRRRRKALDLTQTALAQRVGCALITIQKIEADERRPSREVAERLADILAVPAQEREQFLRVARAELAVDRLAVPAVNLATGAPGAHPLPNGTVTFLFTDIEGSTQLWEQHLPAQRANAPIIGAICARLDGLPLAIELAAARIKLLTPEALLARLAQRLQFLTGGARDLPARQQTVRATIDWSYHLLDAAERRLFARLAVFVGGWTLEAAEAVCDASGDLGIDVLDGLQSLVDKSLVRQERTANAGDAKPAGLGSDGEPCFRRLETFREYARERLVESGELEALRGLHARGWQPNAAATRRAGDRQPQRRRS